MKRFAPLLAFACLSLAVCPAAELVVRDTIGRDWANEPIAWDLPGVKADGVIVTRDGKPIPAQAVATPDGTRVLCIIDSLPKDGTTTLKAEPGKAGPAATDLKVEETADGVVLSSAHAAIRLPSFQVRTPSGRWTAGATYATSTAKPAKPKVEILERGPVRLAARVTTPFDNGTTHAVTVSLWSGARSIDIDETFDVGPADKYQFKPYKNDRDELAWEWWSWFGDKDGAKETHPNNWIVRLDGEGYAPAEIAYAGSASTDAAKGPTTGRSHDIGVDTYTLAHAGDRRLEKYAGGQAQWRPDAVVWYLSSASKDDAADAVAIYPHSARDWRNPNILPVPEGVTLRTGVNDLRIVSRKGGKQLDVECPIGLGRRVWAIRTSTRGEMLAPAATSPTALDAERVKRCMGLDITRNWITSWESKSLYPRLFVKPEQKAAYYARLKGKGIGSPGNVLDTFLRNQDQAGFDKDYALIMKQADDMLAGYLKSGMDITVGYPGWMLGYWHGMIVASGLDNLAGSEFCTPEKKAALQKKLAILTYCLTSKDAWSDKQINYGWGSMNMPVARWGGLVVMASALGDHPMSGNWLKDAGRYFDMLLETEYSPDGVAVSCPHYIGASSTSFYAWIILANSGQAADVSKSPVIRNFARFYQQLMTPIDPRFDIRTLISEGDSRPGSSPFPGILGTLFRASEPELAGQLMQLWKEGGSDLSAGMGVPDLLIIDPDVPARPLALRSEVYPGFGAFLRNRPLSTPEESYLAFMGGNFMIDHANTDQFAFHWHEKGVPLSVFNGSLYQPTTCTALSHNTIAWDVRPGGANDPGQGKPGNWYHDNDQPHVDLGGKTPTTHYEIGWDRDAQKVTETRGLVTRAAECTGASLLEGTVTVEALVETPTRANDYSIAIASQAWPPPKKLDQPFTWTRRLLAVRAPTAAGMNYLVIRDDFGGWNGRTPNFNYWALADGVTLGDRQAVFKGGLGLDTDLRVLAPAQVKLHQDAFTNKECESVVGGRYAAKHGKPFSETYALCRVEGQKGQGFFVVLFPRKPDEPAPVIEPWAGDRGVKVAWKGETHHVLLDTREQPLAADGLDAKAAAIVLKSTDDKNWSLALPLGGAATFRGESVKADGPAEIVVAGGARSAAPSRDLTPAHPARDPHASSHRLPPGAFGGTRAPRLTKSPSR